ncbi:4Fe-4S binding protein [Nonomuraea endophytica]|uniref:NADH-quinone oxidoreductase subunit I n=1 Tax=Nonomuraea endophytica TaxID=714136 RepID=A0A7W7ZY72_9ACTN|nr:4Fe-4S binding protein [Nonomuraea endophytica]MBB5075426.1 formate hydrogenlyase subunit 6/NADH:ubiquinone oxidoreductase subunit I [Nonomuraea endophytica]
MVRIPGVGLAKGLSITLRHMLRRSVTQQYPEVKPALPARSRGVIALVEENCTSCMLCARECPDWCIYIDSHKETLPAPEGGRPRQRNVLDRFAIDFALCMYCGICIEVCPFDALFWSPEFEYAEGDIRNLLHEKEQLGTWVETVPPPPAHDAGAEPPKELTAAPRRPSGTAGPSARQAPSDTPTPRRTPRTRDTPEAKPPPEGSTEATPTDSSSTDGSSTAKPPADRTPPTATPPQTSRAEATPPEASLPEATSPEATPTEGSLTEATPTGAKPTAEPPAGTAPEPAEEPTPPASAPKTEAEGGQLSTGEQSGDKLSTGSGESSRPPDSGEQTSAASPRRRRMADPRSIRPPGQLQSGETQESEEDS